MPALTARGQAQPRLRSYRNLVGCHARPGRLMWVSAAHGSGRLAVATWVSRSGTCHNPAEVDPGTQGAASNNAPGVLPQQARVIALDHMRTPGAVRAGSAK